MLQSTTRGLEFAAGTKPLVCYFATLSPDIDYNNMALSNGWGITC